MLHLRGALLGLALTGLTAMSQTTPPAKTAPATPPMGTALPSKAPSAMPTVSPTQIAATVNGEAIYEIAVQRALERVPPARRAEERPRLINYLVDNLLIDQSLRAAGYKVENSEVDKRVTDMRAELKKGGNDFDKMLSELKVSEAELRTHIAADLRWYRYADAQATDKVLQDLFSREKDMFDGTAVKARHILLTPASKDEQGTNATIAQAQQIKRAIETEVLQGLAKLPASTDKLAQEKTRSALLLDTFAKYAKERSECPMKNHGGEVGWVRKVSNIVAPFADAAFKLPLYQISEPVLSPFGCHLILVTERKPGRDVKFEEVKEIVKEVYFERLHEGLAKQLRPKASITIHPASR